jgi:hypothetical protein
MIEFNFLIHKPSIVDSNNHAWRLSPVSWLPTEQALAASPISKTTWIDEQLVCRLWLQSVVNQIIGIGIIIADSHRFK